MEKKTGPKNLITDVPGVQVGHQTLQYKGIHTGVTAILPHSGNIFREKLPAAVHVVNGFGKSVGTIQVEELGTLETPILLTNTFGVGTAVNALIKSMLEENPEIGDTTGTVNPLVFECNDGNINDIRRMAVTEADCLAALQASGEDFAEGAVGAGTGMCCYNLKGGIGSASRLVELGDESYTLGCLVLSNFGQLEDLNLYGSKIGGEILDFYASDKVDEGQEKGSIIVILATDIPMTCRQLKRLCKRASVGITRTGAFIGNGSGEIVLGFSTAQRIAHFETAGTAAYRVMNENYMDVLFKTTVEVVEESVISSLVHSEAAVDKRGRKVRNLLDCLREMQGAEGVKDYSELLRKIVPDVKSR